MKQIILIRHAKVDIENSKKIDAASLKQWVEAYDKAEIDVESLPSQKTRALVGSADLIVTSTLKRAIDSAKVLDAEIYESNTIFNEGKIPEIKIPFLKLKPKTWLLVLRVLFLFGWSNKDASLNASNQQAKKGVKRLLEFSKEHDTVVLVGHGGMNWLMRKVLMKEGWILEEKPSNKNWGVTILTV